MEALGAGVGAGVGADVGASAEQVWMQVWVKIIKILINKYDRQTYGQTMITIYGKQYENNAIQLMLKTMIKIITNIMIKYVTNDVIHTYDEPMMNT